MAAFAAREEVIARYRADFARLRAGVMLLDAGQRDHPVVDGWTAKDVVAHIAAWDRELASGVWELLAGRRPEFISYVEDEFNARVVGRSRDLSFNDALREAEQAHAALMGTLEQITDQQWTSASAYTWQNGLAMTIASVFDYQYHGLTHYAGHAAEIETWSQATRLDSARTER